MNPAWQVQAGSTGKQGSGAREGMVGKGGTYIGVKRLAHRGTDPVESSVKVRKWLSSDVVARCTRFELSWRCKTLRICGQTLQPMQVSSQQSDLPTNGQPAKQIVSPNASSPFLASDSSFAIQTDPFRPQPVSAAYGEVSFLKAVRVGDSPGLYGKIRFIFIITCGLNDYCNHITSICTLVNIPVHQT